MCASIIELSSWFCKERFITQWTYCYQNTDLDLFMIDDYMCVCLYTGGLCVCVFVYRTGKDGNKVVTVCSISKYMYTNIWQYLAGPVYAVRLTIIRFYNSIAFPLWFNSSSKWLNNANRRMHYEMIQYMLPYVQLFGIE